VSDPTVRPESIDPQSWATRLGVSREAAELVAGSDVIDLHLDTFIWTRLFGYDIHARHGHGLFDARFYSQADLPRMREGGVDSAFWSITTNPFRRASRRPGLFWKNLARLRAIFDGSSEIDHVRSMTEYRAARAAGRHAGWIAIQGGNCFTRAEQVAEIPDDSVVAITLVHLSTSPVGVTSAPDPLGGRRERGLTAFGKEYVAACDEKRILVDLAHIHPEGFWDAVDVHDATLPLIDTHTGVVSVTPHWRNLDDAQIRAIANTGGTIGIIFQCSFLGGGAWGGNDTLRLFAHLAHVVDVAGEDHASLGSDWDGAIVTPRDMPTVLELPVLVQHMLDARWSDERIRKVLAGNALRVMEQIRP
jgi:membrane dipeptidase